MLKAFVGQTRRAGILAVFAVALAFKVLKFGKALKGHLSAPPLGTDQFRQTLERIWVQEQKGAKGRT